jgi:hypothetical protein
MLEQIHTAPEDRRTTRTVLALTTLSFGALALADSLATATPAEGIIGGLTVIAALAGLRRMRAA